MVVAAVEGGARGDSSIPRAPSRGVQGGTPAIGTILTRPTVQIRSLSTSSST